MDILYFFNRSRIFEIQFSNKKRDSKINSQNHIILQITFLRIKKGSVDPQSSRIKFESTQKRIKSSYPKENSKNKFSLKSTI